MVGLKRQLIDRQVTFLFSVLCTRYWYVNNYYCRDDDGPAIEDMANGYRAWVKHGKFI